MGSDSSPPHLGSERHQPSESVDAQVFLRKCHQCLRVQVKLQEEIAETREENKSLSQQLRKAKTKADGLEKEVEQLKKALLEKTLALGWAEREVKIYKRQALDWHECYHMKDQNTENSIKKANELQQQLTQFQSANVVLQQQLVDVETKAAQEQMVSGGAFTCEADKVEKEVR